MKKISGSLLISLLLFSCTEKSITEKKKQVLGLQDMNDLATAEYTITKVVKASDNRTWFKFGPRKILLSCTGIVKAGIDMSQLKEEDIMIENNSISLVLPPARIISINLPPEFIRYEHEKIGFFRDHYSNTEQNELMIQAENQIRQVADSIGILTTAQKNTKLFVTNFLTRLGYKQVLIDFKPVKPAAK